MAATKPRAILQQGLRSAQPAATAVVEGTLYYVTDEEVIERSNAVAWQGWPLVGSGGDVVGPASAVTARIATFNGTTGKLIQDSGETIADVLADALAAAIAAILPIDLAADVTGVLPTANGGTSVNIASAALPLGSGQITFPATQNPSADANTLDDYEEGTWTPTIVSTGGGTPTYTLQTGAYVKIGRMVMLDFQVVLATMGTLAAGDVSIGGLPFTVVANAGCAIAFIGGLVTAVVWVLGNPAGSTTQISLRMFTAAATGPAAMTDVDIQAGTNILASALYRV